MGKQINFAHSGQTHAPAKAAFDALADAPAWAKWGKPVVLQAKFSKTASPDPRGVGSVRAVGAPPVIVKEETTIYEPDREFGYKLVSPAPVREYRGHVTLTPRSDGGTDIHWQGSFEEIIPGSGALIGFAFDRLVGTFLRKLITYLDQQHA